MTGTPAQGLPEPPVPSDDSRPRISPEAVREAHSDAPLALIGAHVIVPDDDISITDNQRKTICIIYRAFFVDGEEVNAQLIWENWPTASGIRQNDKFFRSGPRPSINNIQSYLGTEDFASKMEELGINVDVTQTGLSVEQLGFLAILTNATDGRTLKAKLRAAGVSGAMYQAWMRQPRFAEMYKKWAGQTLMDAIPAAEIQLANAMASGDMPAIRLGLEVTGRHDPANKKQVDAQKLVGLILEVLEEEVPDVDVLRRIGSKIQLRALNALE